MSTYQDGNYAAPTLHDEPMDPAQFEPGPAVSRLCIATLDAGRPGPLTVIQRSGDFQRLYLTRDSASGTELAVAAPGLDEPCLITDLITAIHRHVTQAPGRQQPALVAFHVGVTRLIDGDFRGRGPERVLALVRHPAVRRASPRTPARAGSLPALAVIVSAGLFEELRPEGLPGRDWEPVPSADAWLTWNGNG
jgi:hypothetical protein